MAEITEENPTDRRLAAVGAVGTFLSGMAGHFETDFKYWGYALSALNGVLTLFVVFAQHRGTTAPKLHKWAIYSAVLVVFIVSIGLMTYGLFKPKPLPVPVVATPPAPQSVSHDSYTSSTTGKNSPVINGSNGTYNFGDSTTEAPKVKKQK